MKEILHLLIHFPDIFHSQTWVVPKPGVGNAILVAHVGGRSLDIPCTSWKLISRKLDEKWRNRDLNQAFRAAASPLCRAPTLGCDVEQ